jgi:hypothetical protein
LYWPWCTEKYPGKLYIYLHVYLFILHSVYWNFVEAACKTHKVEPTWSTKWCNEFRMKRSRIPKSQRAEGWVKQVHAHV